MLVFLVNFRIINYVNNMNMCLNWGRVKTMGYGYVRTQ